MATYKVFDEKGKTLFENEDLFRVLSIAFFRAKQDGIDVEVKEIKGNRGYFLCGISPDFQMTYRGEVRDYYYLPTDQYNQPTGDVRTWPMTPSEFKVRQALRWYIFDNYYAACARAQD